jgi:hypothetical protein
MRWISHAICGTLLGITARRIDLSLAACAVRLILLSGLLAIAAAADLAAMANAPDWFGKAIYQSCDVVGMAIFGLWFGSEVVLFVSRGQYWRIWLIIVSLAAMASPWLYVLPAAIFGQKVAEYSTWHLLPLFALLHMWSATVFIGGISGLLIAAWYLLFVKWRPR